MNAFGSISFTRRNALKALAGAAITPVLLRSVHAVANGIAWTGWRTNAQDFFRAPVLLTGEKEAILLDGGFNFAAGRETVKKIKASGKRLTTIYVSCSDPDYYFSLTPVKAAFPNVKVIAASETIAAINANVEKKIAVWGPKLGENGPQSLDEIVFAEPYDEPTLQLEGTEIQIVTSTLLKNRRYLWVPSLEAAFGGVYAFEGLHLWTADSPTPEDRANWLREVEALIARNPKVVVAGHAASGVNNGLQSLAFTRDYLIAYEEAVTKAKDSAALIEAMKSRFPGLGLRMGLRLAQRSPRAR